MIPAMNNTKWNEVRLAMLDLDPTPQWRTRDRHNGFVSSWDGEWYYHFLREGGYDSIEWVEIRPTQISQLPVVVETLREIGVPGHVHDNDNVVTVYGYFERGVDINWL